jgi:hypothetical protein
VRGRAKGVAGVPDEDGRSCEVGKAGAQSQGDGLARGNSSGWAAIGPVGVQVGEAGGDYVAVTNCGVVAWAGRRLGCWRLGCGWWRRWGQCGRKWPGGKTMLDGG